LTFILLLAPASLMVQAQQQQDKDKNDDNGTARIVVMSRLRAAAVQHEVIALAIKENKFQNVLPELKKIFDLELPTDYEIYEVREVYGVIQKLSEKRQFPVAQGAVDLALKYLKQDDSKLALYLMKAGLHRDAGQLREAGEAYEQARKFQLQLESRPEREKQ
jgi:hypothetical protein